MRIVEGRTTVEDVDAFLEELRAIGEATGCAVQAFDARYLVGRRHLERAVELAERAFERGENVARDPAVEVLLYAAGRRQIDRALAMGVGEGETPVAVVVHAFDRGDDGDAVEDRDVAVDEVADVGEAADDGTASDDAGRGRGDPDEAEAAAVDRVRELLTPGEALGADRADEERIRDFFDVTGEELAAADGGLADLVLERVALLEVRK